MRVGAVVFPRGRVQAVRVEIAPNQGASDTQRQQCEHGITRAPTKLLYGPRNQRGHKDGTQSGATQNKTQGESSLLVENLGYRRCPCHGNGARAQQRHGAIAEVEEAETSLIQRGQE